MAWQPMLTMYLWRTWLWLELFHWDWHIVMVYIVMTRAINSYGLFSYDSSPFIRMAACSMYFRAVSAAGAARVFIFMAYAVMAYIIMARIVMAYVVMAYVVMAYVVMVYVVMAYLVMGYLAMVCVFMAYIVGP